MSALAEAAQAYARAGIAVFPLQPGQKRPYGFTPGLHAATCDPDLVAAWWAGREALPLKADPQHPDRRPPFAAPTSNIGIATGGVSGFWVLDLDGPAAEAALQALCDVHGPLPTTVEQRTGAGRHLCFAWDASGVAVRNSASVIGAQIDVRGDGGYIVAPPSVHPGDAAKGIPPGRRYAWCAQRAPGETAFSPPPSWLLRLAAPPERPATPAKPLAPRLTSGRASAYGEACLTTSCRSVASAPAGKRRMAVFGYAAFIGGLVSGGEIERGYAKQALVQAGYAQAQDKAWRPKDLEQLVENGLLKGEPHPQSAPKREAFEHAAPRRRTAEPTPAQAAVDVRDARQLYAAARHGDCGAVRDWFKLRGLRSASAGGRFLARIRAHAAAPIGGGALGPAMLLPLTSRRDGELDVQALAVVPLVGDYDRPSFFVGDRIGCVAPLTSWTWDCDLLVGVDLQDIWALAANAAENGHDIAPVLAPTLRAFAGGYLGDSYGRVDPATPYADPADPPWTAECGRAVWLAVRGDLRTPELKERRTWGGTARGCAEGEVAARFFGGLAEQAWRRAGASAVKVLRPSGGAAFNRAPGRS